MQTCRRRRAFYSFRLLCSPLLVVFAIASLGASEAAWAADGELFRLAAASKDPATAPDEVPAPLDPRGPSENLPSAASTNEDIMQNAEEQRPDFASRFRVGVEVSTLSITPLPIPDDFDAKFTAFVEVGLLQPNFAQNFGAFVRGRASVGYSVGPIAYRPTWIPFEEKTAFTFSGEDTHTGVDISAGFRVGPIETMVDLGVRGGFQPGITHYFGPRVAFQLRGAVTDTISIHGFYEAQTVLSLGDTLPGWTASTSGVGVGVSISF